MVNTMRKQIAYLASWAGHPLSLVIVSVLTLAGCYVAERSLLHMPFISAIFLLLAAIIFFLTRRSAVSVYLAAGVMLSTTFASVLKFRMKGFDLHIYDFFFTGTDAEAMRFLWSAYGQFIAPFAAMMIIGLLLLVVLWRYGRPSNRSFTTRLFLVGVAVVALPLTYPLDRSHPRYFHYLGGFNTSSFFISLLDLPSLAGQPPFSARIMSLPPQQPFPDGLDCTPNTARPDVFIVLSESQTDLGNFPALGFEKLLPNAFRSQNGLSHELYVETFGGGTWIANFSLMTGLSSADFEWQSPYLTTILEGRVRESLPEILARCGYRTASLLPMKDSFVNEGPFLRSIGFETILDFDAIGAREYAHRDSFYFEAAEKFIQKHHESDPRPLFLEIQTMFPHSPYSDRLSEQTFSGSETFAGGSELNEYLSRVYLSRLDFFAFLERRQNQKLFHPSVILEFGDHQSFITKPLLEDGFGGASLAVFRSDAYKTYFSVHAYGHSLDMVPFRFGALDIAFLGISFLQSAGLPLSPMLTDLAELRDHCDGKFHTCIDREAVDQHLKRRVDTGLLRLR